MESAEHVVERLGAVARLQEERAALRDLGELVGEPARLAGEDERGERAEPRLGALQLLGVGPRRLLGGGALAPRPGRPACARARAPIAAMVGAASRRRARAALRRLWRWRGARAGCSAARSTRRTSATWPPRAPPSRRCGLDELVVTVARDPQRKDAPPIAPARAARRDGARGLRGRRPRRRCATSSCGAPGRPTRSTPSRRCSPSDPDGALTLVVGADAAAALGSWHRATELAALVDVAIVPRPGTPIVVA